MEGGRSGQGRACDDQEPRRTLLSMRGDFRIGHLMGNWKMFTNRY